MNAKLVTMLVALSAAPVSAQSFNLDFGQPADQPSAGYAAAGLPGYWNSLVGSSTNVVLNKLDGTPSSVLFHQFGGLSLIVGNDPSTSGDDRLLMDDGLITYNPSLDSCFYFYNLQPGQYVLITYAWRPTIPNLMSKSFVDATPGIELSGGAWPGGHVHGITYARHIVTVDGSGFMGPHSGLANSGDAMAGAVCNGMQLIKIEPPVVFCSGDGSGTPCPCANSGTAGNGCANSLNANGAHLAGMGLASISSDGFMLIGSGMPDSSALYFQGSSSVNGGLGSAFGDGLRCAGGTVIRLGTETNASGASQYPGAGDTVISVKGLNAAGNVRTYQVWYRNAASFCSPATFNLTNGLQAAWVP